jgi:short-subunit dehydrogenase
MKDKLLIIGGTGDISKEIVKKFYKKYDIIITYRDKDKISEIKNYLYKSYKVNITKENISTLGMEIEKIYKSDKITKVIFTNGLMYNNLLITSSDQEIDNLVFQNIEVNIKLMREIIKQSIKIKKELKNFILLTSLAGDVGNSGQSVYSLTKGAMIPFIKSLVREYSSKGLIINTLSLGVVGETRMSKTITQKIEEKLLQTIPLKRYCSFEDINDTIDFLLKTKYLTGQNIKLNGGFI